MVFSLFRKPISTAAKALYDGIVAQARQEVLFTEFGVPDTVYGRFDMVVIHLVLLFYRFKSEDEATRQVGQDVFDLFVRELDHSVRRLGVGDLSVGKKVKRLTGEFYGRLQAYDRAFDAGDAAEVAAIVQRNIFARTVKPLESRALAAYMLAGRDVLQAIPAEDIVSGPVPWPDPATHAPAAGSAGS